VVAGFDSLFINIQEFSRSSKLNLSLFVELITTPTGKFSGRFDQLFSITDIFL